MLVEPFKYVSFLVLFTILILIYLRLFRVDENGNCEQHEEEPLERTCKQDASSSSVERSHDNRSSQPDDKVLYFFFFSPNIMQIRHHYLLPLTWRLWCRCVHLLPHSPPKNIQVSKNKVCPCGSKKKYKACCGAATGRSVAKFVVYVFLNSYFVDLSLFIFLALWKNYKRWVMAPPHSPGTWEGYRNVPFHRLCSRIQTHLLRITSAFTTYSLAVKVLFNLKPVFNLSTCAHTHTYICRPVLDLPQGYVWA